MPLKVINIRTDEENLKPVSEETLEFADSVKAEGESVSESAEKSETD